MAKGKKYTDATKRYDREQLFTPTEAVELVKGLGTASFDDSIELAIRLGVDSRKAAQIVRGTVALPSGPGQDGGVALSANGESAPYTKRGALGKTDFGLYGTGELSSHKMNQPS